SAFDHLMRIALLGPHGQLGTALTGCLSGDVVPLPRATLDVADMGSVDMGLDEAKPELIINATAYNFVDKAEGEAERAYAVNGLGPRNLALWCAAYDVPLVHVSTDYVFGLDASRTVPYVETDAPGPLGAYAISKLAGEAFVRAFCPRHYVVRTCGLYGHAT